MKKVLLAVIVSCLAIAGTAYASAKVHVEEPIYDFGSILEGFAVSHVFTIQNIGDEVLEIDRVATQCGCTTTELATDRLAPGESVELEVVVNTSGFSGRIAKSIYVYSNDPEYADSYSSDRPRYTLRVTGEVLRAQSYHTTISHMNYLLYALVDLRDPAAYEAAHLMGAVNIPVARLSEWLDRLPKDALIVFYDQDGQASEQAAADLKALGYSTVYYTLGGLDEWARWHETFLLETAAEGLELPDREGRIRLACPSPTEDPLCMDIVELRYHAYLLIDLRDPAAYAESHLLGAISIPYAADTEIPERLANLPKDVLILVYDQANEQSDAVAQMLLSEGFNKAQSLLGGLDEWIRQFGERFVTANPE
jgi:rhodanese-related sulfurtransferase